MIGILKFFVLRVIVLLVIWMILLDSCLIVLFLRLVRVRIGVIVLLERCISFVGLSFGVYISLVLLMCLWLVFEVYMISFRWCIFCVVVFVLLLLSSLLMMFYIGLLDFRLGSSMSVFMLEIVVFMRICVVSIFGLLLELFEISDMIVFFFSFYFGCVMVMGFVDISIFLFF